MYSHWQRQQPLQLLCSEMRARMRGPEPPQEVESIQVRHSLPRRLPSHQQGAPAAKEAQTRRKQKHCVRLQSPRQTKAHSNANTHACSHQQVARDTAMHTHIHTHIYTYINVQTNIHPHIQTYTPGENTKTKVCTRTRTTKKTKYTSIYPKEMSPPTTFRERREKENEMTSPRKHPSCSP